MLCYECMIKRNQLYDLDVPDLLWPWIHCHHEEKKPQEEKCPVCHNFSDATEIQRQVFTAFFRLPCNFCYKCGRELK